MKKILYICLEDLEKSLGVKKKIHSQIQSLEKLNLGKVDLISGEKNYLYFNEIKKYEFKNKYIKRLIFYKKLNELNLEKYDLIYIRYSDFTNSYFKFLKTQKQAKIVIEIPTYPFCKEPKQILFKLYSKYYEKNRKKLNKNTDLITYFGEGGDAIWNIPALKLENGINVGQVRLKRQRNKNDEINFIAVANLADWHGYDRMLKSIAKLNKEEREEVKFHIVGEGNTWHELKDLTRELKIDNNVIFYGLKSGRELDEIFDKCDVGIGSLGMYRKGFESTSELKLREYCARGIPFFNSVNDPMFDKEDFKFKVSNDDKVFNLGEVIKWYKNLEITSLEIKNYAEKNCTWDIQMKKVLKKIENLRGEENDSRVIKKK